MWWVVPGAAWSTVSATSDRSSASRGLAPWGRVLTTVVRGAPPVGPVPLRVRLRAGWSLARQHRGLRWVGIQEGGTRTGGRVEGPGASVDVVLHGVVVAWMESDVIAATVANLFAQGCARVFVIDNDSVDGTADVAERAGAEVRRFRSRSHDEALMRLQANALAQEVSAARWDAGEPAPVWWLHVDADEFPSGPRDIRVIDHLRTLPDDVRVVGSRAFDRWPSPSAPPDPAPGEDPVGHLPLATSRWSLACLRLHWKHQLVRLDRDRPTVLIGDGCHRAVSTVALVESREAIVVRHAPFRAEAATRRRIEALSEVGSDGLSRVTFNRFEMAERAAMVDAVYAARWDRVPSPNPFAHGTPVRPRPAPEVESEPAAPDR